MNKSLVILLISILGITANASSSDSSYARCGKGSRAVYQCLATPQEYNEEAKTVLSLVQAFSICEATDDSERISLFARTELGQNYGLSYTEVSRRVGATLYSAEINRSYKLSFAIGSRPVSTPLREVTVTFERFNDTDVDVKYTCRRTNN